MALFEVPGRAGAAELRHKGPICVNVGVTSGSTVTSIVVVAEH
jgi:hypothetical protein